MVVAVALSAIFNQLNYTLQVSNPAQVSILAALLDNQSIMIDRLHSAWLIVMIFIEVHKGN